MFLDLLKLLLSPTYHTSIGIGWQLPFLSYLQDFPRVEAVRAAKLVHYITLNSTMNVATAVYSSMLMVLTCLI